MVGVLVCLFCGSGHWVAVGGVFLGGCDGEGCGPEGVVVGALGVVVLDGAVAGWVVCGCVEFDEGVPVVGDL